MVIWSKPAKADLRHIFEYIAHDSHHYARKVTQEIMDKTGVLNELGVTARNKLRSAQRRTSVIAACWAQAELVF